MNRITSTGLVVGGLLGAGVLMAACSAADGKTKTPEAVVAAPISVAPLLVEAQPIVRYIRATGTLVAEEQADVAAETAGRAARDDRRVGICVDGTGANGGSI